MNVAIIGASSEIAFNLWKIITEKGNNCILTSSDPQKCSLYPEEVRSSIQQMDITSFENIERVIARWHQVNVLVYCPGIIGFKPLITITDDEIIRFFNINVFGFIRVVREAVRQKKISEGGSILAISSAGTRVPLMAACLYTASKGALESTVRALAVELAHLSIRVNAIAPSIILTEKVKQNREKAKNTPLEHTIEYQDKKHLLGVLTPEHVAYAIYNIFCTDNYPLTGQVILLDSGFSIT